MGLNQEIADLFAKRQKIEKEIEILQYSCKHSKKSIKQVRERVDSISPVIRWVCNKCSKIIGYPNNEELQKYLK